MKGIVCKVLNILDKKTQKNIDCKFQQYIYITLYLLSGVSFLRIIQTIKFFTLFLIILWNKPRLIIWKTLNSWLLMKNDIKKKVVGQNITHKIYMMSKLVFIDLVKFSILCKGVIVVDLLSCLKFSNITLIWPGLG